MPMLSLVVPVYFNAGSLPKLFEKINEQRQKLKTELKLDLEVIFVDDGSGDNSFEILSAFTASHPGWVRLIKLTRNFSSTNATHAGIMHAKGDAIMGMSADLQEPPELIYKAAQAWKKGHKFVIGVRQKRHDPLFTKLYARLFYMLVRKWIISDYPKSGFDFLLLDRQYIPYIERGGRYFNISIFTYWLGVKPEIIHYIRQKREHGKSRWSFFRKIQYSIDTLVGFSVVPLRITSGFGIIVSLISFFYGLWLIISRLFINDIPVPGYTSTIVIMTFLLGVAIFMLGLIGEYLWRIYSEVNGRPKYIIEEIK